MHDLWVALGLVLVIEGALYALFPGQMKRMMKAVMVQPDVSLRVAGIVSALIGLGVVWILRG